MKKTLLLTAAILLMATGAFAQASVNSTASATIVGAISVAEVTPLNFGLILPPSATDATVTVDEATGAISQDQDAMLLGGESRAEFSVTGGAGADYSITITDNTITLTDGTNNMNATLALDAAGGTIPVGGVDTRYVGGDLVVTVAQPAGLYQGTYQVNVAYN